MKTTIIINVFNRLQFLEKGLLALYNQNQNFNELIISDDGSTEDVESVIKTFAEKVDYKVKFISQEHTGFRLAKCRNNAIRTAEGEFLIFMAFGPLVTLGAYYVNTGDMCLEAFAVGVPQGFLITGVIWINQFPDYEADKSAGKKNLVVLLGRAISRYLYCLIMILSFISVILLVSMMGITYLIMLAFISFPLAFKSMIVVWRKHLDYKAMIPAQAMTIQTVIAQGLLVSLGLFLSRFINV